MNSTYQSSLWQRAWLVLSCGGLATALLTLPSVSGEAPQNKSSYMVVVKKSTLKDPAWQEVVTALQKKYGGALASYETSIDEVLGDLQKEFPRHTCFVASPEEATREFVANVHQLTRKLDDDVYTDTRWGILTGYDAANALAIARHSEPLVVKKVASGTEFATEMVTEGQWYDELVKNKHVSKEPGGKAVQLKGPDDTTKSIVDLLNVYQPDLMITSGHATERDWQLGFRFRNGQFRCADGRLYGLDLRKAKHPVASPNPKVYMPIGNCLMGHVNDRDAMALAWMNSAGVMQMLGYTIPTGYGYGGWGCLDYFVEQPGRYTFNEAYLANHHALVQRMHDPATDARTRQRLRGDLDVVAFYGDPKWSAKMVEMPGYYEIKDGTYTLTITPRRGEDSFKAVNTNGSERGGRPMVQFLPDRIKDVEILAGADLKPVITDDFILIPNPRTCDPKRDYQVVFKALEQ
jgi:zinc protease